MLFVYLSKQLLSLWLADWKVGFYLPYVHFQYAVLISRPSVKHPCMYSSNELICRSCSMTKTDDKEIRTLLDPQKPF